MARVAVVDASVLIGHLDPADPQHHQAGTLLLAETDEIVASILTIAEVLVAPARTGQLATAESALSQLEIRPVALPANAPGRLAALRASSNLRMPDCCVLLAAQDSSADLVLTLDARLGREARRLGFTVPTG